MIHATAIIHPGAKVDPTCQIGPYVVIDDAVELGPHCVLGPYVYITGCTSVGAHNRFFAGCIIGEAPQDLKYKGEQTRLRIGDHNVFREHMTVHRSSQASDETIIGSHNFLMQHSHVGHNVVLGDHVILGGGVLLAGYATVADRAFLSGNCLVHQFVRVGNLALMQGGSRISKDLPPFTVACDGNFICGLNTVGLRRAGHTAAERLELKQLYRVLFRDGMNFRAAVASARPKFLSPASKMLLDFISDSKRGVCTDVAAEAGPQSEEDA